MMESGGIDSPTEEGVAVYICIDGGGSFHLLL